jgi:uncharacterized protein (UPF0264 family)
MSKETQQIQEGLFGTAKKISDAFFDGLRNNTINSFLEKAEERGMESPIITKMRKLQKEKEELDMLLKKYSK